MFHRIIAALRRYLAAHDELLEDDPYFWSF